MAKPRFSCLTMSATMAPPLVNGTAAKIPCSNRMPINIFKLVESAQATEKMTKPMQPVCWTIVLPYNSDNGANNKGPVANPRTKTVTTKEASVELSEWNSFIRAGTPGANIDELRPAIKVMIPTRLMSTQRRHEGQFIGFSLSDSPFHDTMLASSELSSWMEEVSWPDSRSSVWFVLTTAFSSGVSNVFWEEVAMKLCGGSRPTLLSFSS